MLTLVDDYGGTLLVFVLGIFELMAIFWIYGLENFCWDVQYMTKCKVSIFWRVSWGIVTPLFMIAIFFYFMVNYQSPTYGGQRFPLEYLIAGWIIFGLGMIQIVVWACWVVGREYGKENLSSNMNDNVRLLFTPTEEWGPNNVKLREEWIKFKSECNENRDRVMKTEGHSWFSHKIYVLCGKYDIMSVNKETLEEGSAETTA